MHIYLTTMANPIQPARTLTASSSASQTPGVRLRGAPGTVVVVVVVLVVVVRTLCLYDVSVHATQLLAMNSGGRSPGSQTPGESATPSPP